jgi:phosphatidylglycerophosphatase A
MNRLGVAIATAFGLGYAPIAPGTAGSAGGVLIYLLTASWSFQSQLLLAAAVTAVGVWACFVATKHFGRKDPGHAVVDEVAGQLVTMLGTGASWKGAIIGFLLFRVFDIIKPPPARQLEALPGGWGIMADDIMAALYSCAILHAIIWMVPGMR